MYERCSILKKVETRTSGGTGPVDSLVMPDSSASDNLLLDTIVRIRIATKLITPMLTELPGEVWKLADREKRYREALENIAATTIPELDYTFEEAQRVAREALQA